MGVGQLGETVLVVGMARSGVAAATFLARRGRRVIVTDRKSAAELGAAIEPLRGLGVELDLGTPSSRGFNEATLVVVSPGVPWDLPELVAARAAGVNVMGELELGYRNIPGPVLAVTGTKGKSTTTAALGKILRECRDDVRVGGNIGDAVTGLLDDATAQSLFVLEVSSFQLESIQTFRPHIAVFLNLSTDHLDRHPTFEDYARAKARIFENQTPTDWAVINADDPGVLERARSARSRLFPFHPLGRPEADGSYFIQGDAWIRREGHEERLFRSEDVQLPGAHLAVDLLAAATAARLVDAPLDAIASAVRSFTGVEHVLERVTEVRGVVFYNDSKATNIEAARRSLEAFDGPLIPILGGRYKGGDFAELAPALRKRAKQVMAIGEAQPLLIRALSGVVPVVACSSLREAVERAFTTAEPGDTVLLAPACSSFDMFRDYAERGRSFKTEVLALASSQGHSDEGQGSDG